MIKQVMTIEEIENLAEGIYGECNPRELSPFPFENIQNKNTDLKIFLSDELPLDISGLITFNKNDKVFEIVVNKNKPATRQQFTIAHELGHFYLHKEKLRINEGSIDGEDTLDGSNILYRKDSVLGLEEEIEANRFAASLLMPKRLVYKVWQELGRAEDCARVFKVSQLAMTIRLQSLGLLN